MAINFSVVGHNVYTLKGPAWAKYRHDAWFKEIDEVGTKEYVEQLYARYYLTSQQTYCPWYESPSWLLNGPYTGTIKVLDRYDGYLIAPAKIGTGLLEKYHFTDTLIYSFLRVRNISGTKWLKVLANPVDKRLYITCSNASENIDIYDWYCDGSDFQYSIDILVTGGFTVKGDRITTYTNTCNAAATNQITRNSLGTLFGVDEPITFELGAHLEAAVTSRWHPWLFYCTAANLPDLPAVSMMPFSLLNLTNTKTGTQNNDIGSGIISFNYGDLAGAPYYDAHWEHNIGCSAVRYASYTQFYDSTGTPGTNFWTQRLKAIIYSFGYYSIERYDVESSVNYGLMNADGSKYIYCYRHPNFYTIYFISSTGINFASPNTYIGRLVLTVIDGIITFALNREGYADITLSVYFAEIFGTEEAYLFTKVLNSRTVYGTYSAISPSFANNMAWDQTPNTLVYTGLQAINYESTEILPITYTCYVKHKIRNSQDFNDPDSLYGMAPGSPSDANEPLKAGDSCIVYDKYNRLYFYKLMSGSQQDALPDIVRSTDTLYWQLISYFTNTKLIVEQYDIEGLVLGTDVIITHSPHNRGKSYAPAIQLLQNNTVRTHGVTVSVISNTQLRISTSETVPLENLKINIFITT